MDFDASGALGAELEAFTESDLLLSHCLLASNDLKMSINESGSPVTEDELLILKASTKHSLATSIPSASTPGLGSTIQHKPKPKSKSKSKLNSKAKSKFIHRSTLPCRVARANLYTILSDLRSFDLHSCLRL
jgi:hypothetical protein